MEAQYKCQNRVTDNNQINSRMNNVQKCARHEEYPTDKSLFCANSQLLYVGYTTGARTWLQIRWILWARSMRTSFTYDLLLGSYHRIWLVRFREALMVNLKKNNLKLPWYQIPHPKFFYQTIHTESIAAKILWGLWGICSHQPGVTTPEANCLFSAKDWRRRALNVPRMGHFHKHWQ